MALSEMLEANDKQHFILLNDKQQLQDQLALVQSELSLANQSKDSAIAACKSAEHLLTEAQVHLQPLQICRALQDVAHPPALTTMTFGLSTLTTA